MSEENQNPVDVETDASYLSFLPGQRLKKARELRGLSVAQVAKDLNLSERYVEAMESDDYKALPEPAFVRGYMRRYAQLVKLSADDIAAKFDECYAADTSTPEPDARPRNPIQLLGSLTRNRVPWKRLMSWSGILLVVALIAGTIFWRAGSSHAGITASPDVGAAPQSSAAAVVAAPANSATPVVPVAPVAPAATSATPAPTVLPVPQSPTPIGATLPAPGAAAAAPAGVDTVVLHFAGDSWVSVRDAGGKDILSGMQKAGQSTTLSGTSPFTVSIGNAPQTTLQFNGKTIDLAPYTQGNVANFKLSK